ncbi:MAG: nuclear transport factor 2 family protein [Chryseolinea sp.]
MKLLSIALMMTCIAYKTFSQDPREAEIRRLDNLEREAVLRTDSAALFNKLWSSSMIINTPANVVGTVEGTKAHLRSGGLAYGSFERTIEMIRMYDNVAIVMGGEVIKPQGKQLNAGKTVSRRFTHVWMLKEGAWSIIARQATIIKIE